MIEYDSCASPNYGLAIAQQSSKESAGGGGIVGQTETWREILPIILVVRRAVVGLASLGVDDEGNHVAGGSKPAGGSGFLAIIEKGGRIHVGNRLESLRLVGHGVELPAQTVRERQVIAEAPCVLGVNLDFVVAPLADVPGVLRSRILRQIVVQVLLELGEAADGEGQRRIILGVRDLVGILKDIGGAHKRTEARSASTQP